MTDFPLNLSEIIERIFKSKNFSSYQWNGKFFLDCSFENCNFTKSVWQNAKFIGCSFSNCNISLIKLDGCRLQDVKFVDCKIVGADFFKCDPAFFSIACLKSFLQYSNFSDLNMKRISFEKCKLKECHFSNALLMEGSFKETELPGTIFHHCDLSKADFSSASQYNINPETNKIKKAKFSLPEAIGLLRGFDIIIT